MMSSKNRMNWLGGAAAVTLAFAGFAGNIESARALELPALVAPNNAYDAILKDLKNSKLLADVDKPVYATLLAKYMAYLGIDPLAQKALYSAAYNRLINSSTQFLACPSLEDFACLEAAPRMRPKAAFRQDALVNLGAAVNAGPALALDYFFSTRFDNKDPAAKTRPFTLAPALTKAISGYATAGMSMALYGIDDITSSMKSVYDTIVATSARVPVRAVFDIEAMRTYDHLMAPDGPALMRRSQPIVFSYAQPVSNDPRTPAYDYQQHGLIGRPAWMGGLGGIKKGTNISATSTAKDAFSQGDFKTLVAYSRTTSAGAQEDFSTAVRTKFQYGATATLLQQLNRGITKHDDARARIEWPAQNIMHNKFLIMDAADRSKAVWTGTANVARSCIGNEENSNMSIFIRNTAIASAFQGEFNEMWEHTQPVAAQNSDGTPFVNEAGQPTLMVGKFKIAKRPNTPRYFVFGDGTEVRVHFSPTDDAEHRVIIPMLLSAQLGDLIRISAFGGSGIEIVRAIQYALAKGASVRIVMDNQTGSGAGSWIKDTFVKLQDPNPFIALVNRGGKQAGQLQVRLSDWFGLNHMKIGSLTRGGFAQMLVIGSQNWTSGGNDENDENVVTIRNRKGVAAAAAFNQHFDTMVFTSARKKILGN